MIVRIFCGKVSSKSKERVKVYRGGSQRLLIKSTAVFLFHFHTPEDFSYF